MARSMVGDGSIGSPSLHIRSFQLSQRSLSARRIIATPFARISADCAARMPAIARDAFPSSLSEPCGRRPKGAWGDASAPSGHPTADQIGMWARSYRSSASTHPLQVCRHVAGMYRPKAVARRASRLRWRRKDGPRQPSGFPLCGRSAGRRRAARGAEFLKAAVGITGNHSPRRADRSARHPSTRREVQGPAPRRSSRFSGPLRPTFPSVSGSACASSQVGHSYFRIEHNKNKRSSPSALN
jgi:hypothetical protein